jgi:signal transduction histidine kinase/DNA-binding response OmpR family regulator
MREKVAALVTVLVIIVGLVLPGHLFEASRHLVEEHEIVDLRDEAALRAWELVGRVDMLVEDVRGMSRDLEWLERIATVGTSGEWTEGLQPGVRGEIEHYVRFELLGEGGRMVAEAGQVPSPSSGTEDAPDWRADLMAAIQVSGEAGKVFLSPIHHAVMEGDDHPKPVIWGGALSTSATGDRVVLVLLDLEQTVGTNRTDPRHLYFLARDEGTGPDGKQPKLTFAVHPDETLALRSAKVAEDNTFVADAGLVEAIEQGKPEEANAQNAVQPIPMRLSGMELARDYYFVQGVPDERLAALIVELAKRGAESKELSDRMLDFQQNFRRQMGDNTRLYLPANAVSQVRLLSASKETVERVMSEFPLRLAEFLRRELAENAPDNLYQPGEKPVIDWGKPTHCRECDIWMVHLHLRGDGNEHTYRLAYAAFREELNYAITQEMRGLRLEALIFGILAGLFSFVVSLWFIRPLVRITRTAGSAADSAGLHEAMQQKINEVRESLPVKRSDEVGDIARALERMLREVLNGHERLRQAKVDLDRQVDEQTQELREKNTQLQRLAQDKDAFLGNVSHELRQPLNALFGFTQLLELSDLDEGQKQDLGKIRKEAQHLLDLINDILDYQKIIMEGLDLEPETIPLPEFLADMRDSMAGTAEKDNNRVVVELGDAPAEIRNDRKRLRQVLANLMGNACKFTKDGTITLAASKIRVRGQDWIEIGVRDSGRGMKEEEMNRLFTKFAKLSAKEGNPGGTGLGLVISKGLCELMGGGIEVESEFGKGSNFMVRVPVEVGEHREEEEQVEAPPEEAAVIPAPAPRKRRKRPLVLVIDDDESVREIVARFLAENEMDVITAPDGPMGIEMAVAEQPDVITLDAVMPKMDGWDVLAKLKSDPATAAIPVVMVSFLEQEERGYALGASDYVVKPIDWGHLAGVIERHLNGHRDSAILVVDDDESTREIMRRTLEGAGWEVWEAENGKVALDLMAEKRPAMILLDLMMPVMDGFDFINEFSQHPEWRTIPVVVVTAKDPNADEKRLLEGSVVRVLQKGSYGQSQLLNEIQAQVELQLNPPEQAQQSNEES